MSWRRNLLERPLLLTAAAVLVALSGAALVALPSKGLFLAAVGVLGVALTLLSVAHPPVMVHVIILSSPFAGLVAELEKFEIGGRTVSLSGVRWIVVTMLLVLVLLSTRTPIRIPRVLIPLWCFGMWMALRSLLGGADPRGFGDVLFYLLPPGIAIYTTSVLAPKPGLYAARIARLIMASVFIPVLLYATLIPAGLVVWKEGGPQGILGPRPVATYLVMVLCVTLAWWRHGSDESLRRWALMLSLLALGVVVFTSSRMATVTAVLLFVTCRVNPRRTWRLLSRGAGGVALALVVLLLVPRLRERLFLRAPESLSEAASLISWSGRDVMWATTFEHALHKPVVGWGPGTARPLVAAAFDWEKRDDPPQEYPPHNEYLQVFHDGGVVGLVLLVWGWLHLLVHHYREWKRAHAAHDSWLSRWYLAAVLGITAVLINALVDNTLHYTTVTGPLFVILGCASSLAAMKRSNAGATLAHGLEAQPQAVRKEFSQC